jgi:hypothetical protein
MTPSSGQDAREDKSAPMGGDKFGDHDFASAAVSRV